MRQYALLFSLIAIVDLAAPPTQAQVVTNLDPSQTYLAVTSATLNPAALCTPPFCVNPSQGIPLSTFATSTSVAGQFSSVNSQINAINSRMSNQVTKAFEGVAIASAMGDAIPNPGDRFAVRLNAGGFYDQAAGAISFSYAFEDNARASVNFGQSQSQSVVSAGLTLSFH